MMSQFRILIVDDEVHAIRGIEAGVKWGELGITSIHTAHNLRQAQEVFQNHKVDLLLSDIDMPRGSGIDLLRWVRENYPSTEAVFLTCHSDFSYAKQAIQLKSLNYLLKPVDYHELEEVLKSALEKIKNDREINMVEESYLHLQKIHSSIMKERFWLDLLNQVVPSSLDKIQDHMKYHKVTFPEKTTFLPCLIHVQRWKDGLTVQEERILETAFKNAVEEKFSKNNVNAPVVSLATGYLLVIFPLETPVDSAELKTNCDLFIAEFSRYFSCNLCCYLGKQVPIHKLVTMVDKLKELDRNNVTLTNKTIEFKGVNGKICTIPKIPSDAWTGVLKSGPKEKILNEIQEYFESWHNHGGITAQSLHLFYQDYLQMLFYVLQVKGLQANQVFTQNLLTDRPEKVFRSLNSLHEWVLYITEVAMNQLHSPQEGGSVVDRVKQFIKENIGSQKMSREDIANHVYLNPDYLTRVFKKQTGLSISDYLQQERLEYAKKLLIETNQSVSDIALEAGYSNFSYFSTIFKKATTLNPLEFRKVFSEKSEYQK